MNQRKNFGTLKLLEENIGNTLYYVGIGNVFLNRTQKTVKNQISKNPLKNMAWDTNGEFSKVKEKLRNIQTNIQQQNNYKQTDK